MAIYDIYDKQLTDAYDMTGLAIDFGYNIDGDEVYSKTLPQYNYNSYTVTDLFTYTQSSMQSFAIYKNKIAQVKQTSAIHIIDIDTEAFLKSVSMDTGHGNSCQFSNEYYARSDEFPLFYVRNDGIWIYRIVGTSSTLIKKYSFDPFVIGEESEAYVAGFGIDDKNKRLYTVSYTQGTYLTKTGLLRVCVWDMDTETDEGDGVYSLELLASNDMTWFDKYEAVQGCCYRDGYMFIACGYGSGQQYVVLINTSTLLIEHEISLTGAEIEGCAWHGDDYLIVGQGPSNITYRKVEFTEVEA